MEEGPMALSTRDRDRLKVLSKAKKGPITQKQAAQHLDVTDRQIPRRVTRMREQGDRSILHGLRGQPSNPRIPEAAKQQALSFLATKEYVDFGPTLASEYLGKKRGLWIGKALCANVRDTFPVVLIREQGGKKMNHEPTSERQGAMLLGRPLPPIRTARTVDESALVQTPVVLGNDGQVSRFVPVEELFKGRHFDQEIVVLCVRWYLSFKLIFRDLVAMMSERGLKMAYTTSYSPPQFERRWKCYTRSVGGSWRMDETYVRVKGEWRYLYRAVDKAGKTVDFILSLTRDENAAKTFLRKAMTDSGFRPRSRWMPMPHPAGQSGI